eukprot:4111731-Alexandrium_andersonii.AAC.1
MVSASWSARQGALCLLGATASPGHSARCRSAGREQPRSSSRRCRLGAACRASACLRRPSWTC